MIGRERRAASRGCVMARSMQEQITYCADCLLVAQRISLYCEQVGLDFQWLPGCKSSFIIRKYAQFIGLDPALTEQTLLEASEAKEDDDLGMFDKNKPLLVNGGHRHLRYRGNKVPRRKMWFQDADMNDRVCIYAYTGFQYAVTEAQRNISVSPLVEKTLRKLNEDFGLELNHGIFTVYEDGNDSIGVHTDKLRTIGNKPNDLIVGLKTGEEGRDFVLTALKAEGEKAFPSPFFKEKLEPGTLFCISPYDNMYSCAHGVPQTVCGRTSSLVFRRITKWMSREGYEHKRIACEKTKECAKKRKLNQQERGKKLVPY